MPGTDLSRTAGWFTSIHPVRLDAGNATGGAAIKAVKEQLRAVPDGGIGYGLLRYGGGEAAAELAAAPPAQIAFNYLGRIAPGGEEGDWTLAAEELPPPVAGVEPPVEPVLLSEPQAASARAVRPASTAAPTACVRFTVFPSCRRRTRWALVGLDSRERR